METDEEVAAAPERGWRLRPRRGTAVLIGAAAVLGLVAGGCAGYLVQVHRAPTKLPPLSRPALAQARGEGPEPLSAARDRRVKTDGDLRELLLEKPRGARDAAYLMGRDGWLDLANYAEFYEKPGEMFGELVGDEFRRAAVTGWQGGGSHEVEIRLVQFRQEETLAAAENVENTQYWVEDKGGTDSWAIPGSGNGRAYVHKRPDTKPGYVPLYTAEAHAWRGDIALEMWITDTKPIPKAKIMDLAERQLERL
ncbi:hypothetical protein [Streptomyces tibetensis]|uniref:hypothetical protein n=1 Tax=Streptomyces tibetensis TaxID=2382123 RepID=UPI0033C7F832